MRLLAFVLCLVSNLAFAVTTNTEIDIQVTAVTSGTQVPGPSAALFNNPYYTCTRNFYVATTGSDSNNGTSPGTPWLTIAHADTASRTGGDCINVAAGTYAAFNGTLAHGGTTAASNGYVAYRCTTPAFISGSGCIITDPNQAVCTGANCGATSAAYVIIDGFNFTASSVTGSGFGVGSSNGNTGTTTTIHHWFILNNVMTGGGQGGIQVDDMDYFVASHNKIFQTAKGGCSQSFQGSGISFVVPKPVSGYTPTADDTNANNNAALNLIGIQGTTFSFRQVTAWNVTYTNNIGCTAASSASDGNGIIMDSWTTRNGNTQNYPGAGLVAFNVSYNNGGGGIVLFATDNITVANNTVYNNWLNIFDSGTTRYGINVNDSNSDTLVNNIVVGVPASGTCSFSSPQPIEQWNGSIFGGPTNSSSPASTFTTNITASFGSGAPCQGENLMFAPDSYNLTTNKGGTNPTWVAVGNISVGDQNTPPNGSNFALQAGSPAIGYGTAESYLSSQAADAGACFHTLSTCP